MSSFCHGVASAQSLDKSGEIVDIKGLDITSLAKTGIINYEHRSDIPGQICGKILTAKKIFTKDDCSNQHEAYFWDKCRVPFVYMTAELLDDYCQSGKDAAGILRYDHDKKDQNKHAILGFSVEGSEIPNTRGSQKMVVSRGIARKVTLTSAPCNLLCVAELLIESPKSQIKDDFEEIFKSKEEAITLFKSGEGVEIYEKYLAKKEEGSSESKSGIHIGATESGKHVFSHGNMDEYDFNPEDHKDASELHRKAAVSASDSKLADHHIETMKAHNRASLQKTDKLNESVFSNISGKNMRAGLPGIKTGMGQSAMGAHVRNQKSPKSSDGGKEVSKVRATQIAEKNLKKLQNAPKPNLPKSEPKGMCDLHKTFDAADPKKPGISTVGAAVRNLNAIKTPKGKEKAVQAAKEGMSHINKPPEKIVSEWADLTRQGIKDSHKNQLKKPEKISNVPEPKTKANSSEVTLTTSEKEHRDLKKAIEAGSYNVAPSTLINGAAYQTESVSRSPAKTGAEENKFHATKKKDWNKRAKDDYEIWPQKEKFRAFLKARMPHLADGEIDALGRCFALKKSIDVEKILENLVSINKTEDRPNLGNHFLMSAENPMHPHKNELKMNHEQTLVHLKNKGFNAHEVKGHYGSPETSIMVHNVDPKQAEYLHSIASKLGQDSSIYSNNGKHEMRFHHGENASKKVHGEGTVWHKEKPKDFYTTMPNGKYFSHNFKF